MTTHSKKRRSPLDGVHFLRRAGEGAQAKADAMIDDAVFRMVLPPALMAFAWWMNACGLPNNSFRIFFVGSLLFSIGVFLYYRRKVYTWQQGANGERYVGQILDRTLPGCGYKVYHDIQLKRGKLKTNIDHLLVGPNGVFLIEDKTWSKPLKGETRVKLDLARKCVVVNDRCSYAPVREAFGLAKAANAYIRELTGCSVIVKPVLVFPKWYCEGENRHDSPMLILNESGLPSFLPRHCAGSPIDEQTRKLLIAKLDAVA